MTSDAMPPPSPPPGASATPPAGGAGEGAAGGRRSMRPGARGRRVAQVIYYAATAVVIVASTVQIVRQVFFLPVAPAPYEDCRAGLLALARAVERARNAAPGTDGEDAALGRFRSELLPEWGHRDGVAAACRGAAEDERALDAIERLRYAEEHAARREAGDLAPLRRRVREIVDARLGPAPPR